MSAQAKAAKDEKGIISKAMQSAENAFEKQIDVERIKEKASHAIEDGIVDAKRMVKRGRHAAEDFVEDTEYRIKHDPWRAVGITFGVGVGLGVLIGWLIGRQPKETCAE